MLVNSIILIITLVAGFFVVKSEADSFRSWISKDRSAGKLALCDTVEFWREYIRNPIRVVSLVAILILQHGPISMLIAVAILLALSYAFAKMGYLVTIDWRNGKIQKAVTVLSVALAVCWLIGRFGLLNLIMHIVSGIAALLVVIVVISRISRRNK